MEEWGTLLQQEEGGQGQATYARISRPLKSAGEPSPPAGDGHEGKLRTTAVMSSSRTLPHGREGHDDVVQSVVEGHVAVTNAPVGILHLHEEVREARQDEQHHQRLQAPPDELRAQDENLPAEDRAFRFLVVFQKPGG